MSQNLGRKLPQTTTATVDNFVDIDTGCRIYSLCLRVFLRSSPKMLIRGLYNLGSLVQISRQQRLVVDRVSCTKEESSCYHIHCEELASILEAPR